MRDEADKLWRSAQVVLDQIDSCGIPMVHAAFDGRELENLKRDVEAMRAALTRG